MALEPIRYDGVTPDKYATIMKNLAAKGIPVAGNSGSMEYSGCQIHWDYFPEMSRLTVQVMKKPWVYPAGKVQAKLREFIETQIIREELQRT